MSDYNCTQLNPDITFERHVYHRDQFAHYLRWTHVLKRAKIGQNILDWGSGTGNLLEVFYRNRFKCKEYIGLEYRQKVVEKANEKYSNIEWASFKQQDLLYDFDIRPKYGEWDYIISFEVIEHVAKINGNKFLNNIYNHMSNKTKLLLSTPIYDPNIGCAENHMAGGCCSEFTYDELKHLLKKNNFKIEEKYGTFASIKDYKFNMNEWQTNMYNKLKDYYDSNLLSIIMAPFFPRQSRNCIWICTKK